MRLAAGLVSGLQDRNITEKSSQMACEFSYQEARGFRSLTHKPGQSPDACAQGAPGCTWRDCHRSTDCSSQQPCPPSGSCNSQNVNTRDKRPRELDSQCAARLCLQVYLFVSVCAAAVAGKDKKRGAASFSVCYVTRSDSFAKNQQKTSAEQEKTSLAGRAGGRTGSW